MRPAADNLRLRESPGLDMSVIDLDKLLENISDESPCGEDLAYDPAYTGLETMAQGTPEREMGDEIIPGEEPNWREVRERCLELMARTKDLRVVMYLLASLLKIESLPGLRDGLALLQGLLEKYWDQIYPQLDPEDNNDPTERVNIVDSLSKPPRTPGDPMQFQQRLREAELCRSKQMGCFSLRDIAVAQGEVASQEGEGVSIDAIDGAFMDTELDQLQEIALAVDESIEYVKQIDSGLTDRLGAGSAPNLNSFVAVLTEIQKCVGGYLSRRGVDAPAAQGDQDQSQDAGSGATAVQGQVISGEVRSRQDVIRMIDKVCDYYQSNEPSSPVPLLMKRAKRLAEKNFLEIVRDLSPDAMQQIQLISGVDIETESS